MQPTEQPQKHLEVEIFHIVESLGNAMAASTPEARAALRDALEGYARTYPTAYQYIHADNPFLSVILTMLEAQTKANITKPKD